MVKKKYVNSIHSIMIYTGLWKSWYSYSGKKCKKWIPLFFTGEISHMQFIDSWFAARDRWNTH